MAHKHAELMKILAQQILDGVENPGELWERRYLNDTEWKECNGLFPSFQENMDYRLKKKFIMINGFEVPEPERVDPETGTKYFVPCIDSHDYCRGIKFTNDEYDKNMIERGFIHLTKEAAEIHANALLSFTSLQPDLASGEPMAKKLVSELSGSELDYWVAMAEGKDAYFENDRCFTAFIDGNIKYYYVYSPSTNPAQGWPIIEHNRISINYFKNHVHADIKLHHGMQGETILIAAMRCRVASVYGEYVSDDNE